MLASLRGDDVCTGAQKGNESPTSGKQQVSLLLFKDSGKSLAATLGEQIEISLGEMARATR